MGCSPADYGRPAIGLALSNAGPAPLLSEIPGPTPPYFLFSVAPLPAHSAQEQTPAATEWPRGIAKSRHPGPLRSKTCGRSSSRKSPPARSTSVSGVPFPCGSVFVPQLPKHAPQVCVRSGKIRLQANGFPQRIGRRLQVALLLQHRAQGVVSLRIVGFRLNSRAQFLRCHSKFPLLPKRHTKSVVSIRHFRIELLGPLEFRNRLRQAIFHL